eukprot:8639724-Pyramimonas_sp.AAC.1
MTTTTLVIMIVGAFLTSLGGFYVAFGGDAERARGPGPPLHPGIFGLRGPHRPWGPSSVSCDEEA